MGVVPGGVLTLHALGLRGGVLDRQPVGGVVHFWQGSFGDDLMNRIEGEVC